MIDNRLGNEKLIAAHGMLLVLALPFTAMTKLRMVCCNIGPGEIMLIIWVLSALYLVRYTIFSLPPKSLIRNVALFWGIGLSAMAIGAYFGHQYYDWNYDQPLGRLLYGGPLHDFVAYSSLALFSIIIAVYPLTLSRAWAMLVGFSLSVIAILYPLFLFKHFGFSIGEYSLTGTNIARFAGLARNPNQAALLLMFVPAILFGYLEYRVQSGRSNWKWIALIALGVALSVQIGLDTLSTAYVVSHIFGLVLFLGVFAWVLLVKKDRKLMPVAQAVLASLVLVFLLFNFIAVLSEVATKKNERIESNLENRILADIYEKEKEEGLNKKGELIAGTYKWLSEDGDYATLKLTSEMKKLVKIIVFKSEFRFRLWVNGIEAFSESPIVGLGPGPYSGDYAPFQKREVHNTTIDWMINAGIIGLFALVVLIFWMLIRLWKAEHYVLAISVGVLMLYAQFHHILRHPSVWFFLLMAVRVAQLSIMERREIKGSFPA